MTRLLVARSAGWSTVVVVAVNSRRAAAASVHIAGDTIGAVGASPAKGSSRVPTALEIATVATSTEFCGFGIAGSIGSAGGLTIAIVTAGASASGACETSVTGRGRSADATFGVGFALTATDALPWASASAGVRETTESAARADERSLFDRFFGVGTSSVLVSWTARSSGVSVVSVLVEEFSVSVDAASCLSEASEASEASVRVAFGRVRRGRTRR